MVEVKGQLKQSQPPPCSTMIVMYEVVLLFIVEQDACWYMPIDTM